MEIYRRGHAKDVREISEQASPTLPTELSGLSGEDVLPDFVLSVDRFPAYDLSSES